MIVLLKILFAHFVGDFLMQPKRWVEKKEIKKVASFHLYIHILIHGLLMLLFLWDLKLSLLIFSIMIAHGIIDLIKIYAQKENTKALWFSIDQGLHILSILGLWAVFFPRNTNFFSFYDSLIFWIYATALIFITIVSGIAMRELMSSWTKALNDSHEESLNNAGKHIGMLERIFVFTFVVTGNWEGIGFLLAAKSVFRFGDLKESKDRKLTEYILIGTLLSFGIAIASGLVVLKLLQFTSD